MNNTTRDMLFVIFVVLAMVFVFSSRAQNAYEENVKNCKESAEFLDYDYFVFEGGAIGVCWARDNEGRPVMIPNELKP